MRKQVTWRGILLLVTCLLVFLFSTSALAAKPRSQTQRRSPPRTSKKKQGSIADREYTKRRTSCLATSNVQPCKEQDVDVENCIMRCISESCYVKAFPEPLEDGEVASKQVNRFVRCSKEELKEAYKRGEVNNS